MDVFQNKKANAVLFGSRIFVRSGITPVDRLIVVAEQDCHYLFHPRDLSYSIPEKIRIEYEQEAAKYASIVLEPSLRLYSNPVEFWRDSSLPEWHRALRIILGNIDEDAEDEAR